MITESKCCRWLVNIGLVLLSVLAMVSVSKGFINGLRFIDFHWESAAMFLRGINPYQYCIEGRLYEGVIVDATQLPSTIALILPYGIFSHYVGNLLWDISNLIFTGVFLWFVYLNWFQGRGKVGFLIALLFLSSTPFRVCIGNGQHIMYSLMFFAIAYWMVEHRKPWWATGIVLALGAFKYTVMAPLYLFFLFRKEWRSLLLCFALHLLMTVALSLWVGVSSIVLVQQNLMISSWYAGFGVADLGSLARAYGARSTVHLMANVGYVVFGIFAFWASFAGRKNSLLLLAVLSLVANLVCYHRIYDFVTLVFPLIYVVDDFIRTKQCKVCSVVIFALAFFVFFGEKVMYLLQLPGMMEIVFGLHLIALILLSVELVSDHTVDVPE